MTSPSYPAALDALANPGPTTETDDAGYELDIVVARLQNCVMAIEQKLGIGVGGPPGGAAVLRRTATGASAWGGIQASDVTPGAVPALIQSNALAVPTAFVDFNSIPQVYTSLELRIIGRSTAAVVAEGVRVLINGGATGYYNQTLFGSAATAGSNEGLAATFGDIGIVPGASSSTASWFGQVTVDFNGYRASLASIFPSALGTSYAPWGVATATQQVHLHGTTWTGGGTPITALRVYVATASWAAGSIVSLYGYP